MVQSWYSPAFAGSRGLPGRGGMRVSSEALAKEDWSFGGLRRTTGAAGSSARGALQLNPVSEGDQAYPAWGKEARGMVCSKPLAA